ncbi:hypothetical protein B0H19DRAFT_1106374 [Mycena capillaripes]|nr:hypothetical protein B0H19DRAFT_1106374 [Mycena capillaripes]
MTRGSQDREVRHKFQHLLDASYRSFPFANLPVELALRILTYATACSQGTYRSLLLTNKRIAELIRTDNMLAGVSIILLKESQMDAFLAYIKEHPEAIPNVRALWTICPGSVRAISRVCVSIIDLCTNIRSLACHPHVLLESICRGDEFRHARCVDLTMIEFRITWASFMDASASGAKFFHQLERMHFIGALDHSLWATWAVIPKLNNLARASIAMGSFRNLNKSLFERVVESPKLQQVVVTTRLHGEDQQMLSDAAQEIDHRFSVIHRRRRWKESNLWHESLQDSNRFWDQAKEEKFLPPVPRPTSKAPKKTAA